MELNTVLSFLLLALEAYWIKNVQQNSRDIDL